MEAKKKYDYLFEKFYKSPDEYGYYSVNRFRALGNAKYCVDEIIKALGVGLLLTDTSIYNFQKSQIEFWNEVKQELEKL